MGHGHAPGRAVAPGRRQPPAAGRPDPSAARDPGPDPVVDLDARVRPHGGTDPRPAVGPLGAGAVHRLVHPARCARETAVSRGAQIPAPIRDAISVLRFRYDMLKELEL